MRTNGETTRAAISPSTVVIVAICTSTVTKLGTSLRGGRAEGVESGAVAPIVVKKIQFTVASRISHITCAITGPPRLIFHLKTRCRRLRVHRFVRWLFVSASVIFAFVYLAFLFFNLFDTFDPAMPKIGELDIVRQIELHFGLHMADMAVRSHLKQAD